MNGAGLTSQFREHSVRTVLALIVTTLLSPIHPLCATDLLVYNNKDSGPGSLRQAIAENAALGGGNAIVFSNTVTGAITLTNGELLITNDMTIVGPGADVLAVAGNYPDSTNRIFHISNSIVSIAGLAITNGHAPTNGLGGGIYNDHATLVLNHCAVSSNSATVGGGIWNDGSSGSAMLVASNCTFGGNLAWEGGGIGNNGSAGSATLVVSNCTFSGNLAIGADGGGIFNSGFYLGSAVATVMASTLSGNSAWTAGGGIMNLDATCAVIGCVFSGNSADLGGGIHSKREFEAATLSVTNSTFTGNSATNGGAGIWNWTAQPFSALATIFASTISSNSGPIGDRGIANFGRLEIGNTILKPGTFLFGPTIHNYFNSVVISHGYNLSSDNGGGVLTNATDRTNTDPMLGPLQDNGGPTFTHALLPGSPAIDMGKSFGLTTDQRGAPRPFKFAGITNAPGGDGSDIGALESGSPELNIQQVGSDAVLSWPAYYGGFALETSTNMASSNSWITAGGSAPVVGNQYQQTNGPISSSRFFRLRGN